jgi:uncharacterized membrane protein YecN with MAPEG domain
MKELFKKWTATLVGKMSFIVTGLIALVLLLMFLTITHLMWILGVILFFGSIGFIVFIIAWAWDADQKINNRYR